MYKSNLTLVIILALSHLTLAQNEMRTNVSTFDVVGLNANNHFNGNDQKGGFWNGHFYYRNYYDTAWKTWSGFAISNHTDTITNSYTNEYSSISGSGITGTKNYGVCYLNGTIINEKPTKLTGFFINNTTYTYHTIKGGSGFSKKFGGVSGNDPDWFRLKIISFSGGVVVDSLRFYLADFQDSDNKKDYIIKNWTWLDLSQFKTSDSLFFTFESSDVGSFGINTPTYFAFDDFNSAPPSNINLFGGLRFNDPGFFKNGKVWDGEHDTSGGFTYGNLYFENNYNTQWKSFSGWAVSKNFDTTKKGLAAQYTSITGVGLSDSTYAVAYGRSVIRWPYKIGGWPITYFRFSYTNDLYTYKSMRDGDAFSKRFGGILGTDPDYLKLYIIGYDENNKPVDTLGMDDMQDEMFLADFRMNRQYLNKNWTTLISNGFKKNIVKLEFQLESTDNGPFGMNTPAYFCVDNFFEYPIENLIKTNSSNIKLYPNPAINYISVDIKEAKYYEIMDLNGRLLIKIESPVSNKIDVSELPSGMYYLRVIGGDMVYTGRFIKCASR